MARRLGELLRRPRLALKLAGLYLLYGVTRALAAAFESKPARAFWTAVAVAIGTLALAAAITNPRVCPRAAHRAAPSVERGPFDVRQLPYRPVGARFTYSDAVGYQVPMSFFVGDLDGELESATLKLRARMLLPPGQPKGTEAIWVEGVLSGSPHPGFVQRTWLRHRPLFVNPWFSSSLADCCVQRWGDLEIEVERLLDRSGVTVESVLADGRLDVVVADDTEIESARLEVCVNDHGERRCRRSFANP